MRNLTSFDSQHFISECEKFLIEYSEILFRSSASDSPKWLRADFVNLIALKSRKIEDLVLLSLFSYYIPEEVGVLLRLALQEYCDKNPEVFWLHFLLQGKGLMYNFLCMTNLWSTRDFFGNILTKKRSKKFLNLFSFVFKTRKKPKRVLRHRGYRDKGTLKEIHEYHSFASFTKEMNELEEQREILKDTLLFLQGFLEWWG